MAGQLKYVHLPELTRCPTTAQSACVSDPLFARGWANGSYRKCCETDLVSYIHQVIVLHALYFIDPDCKLPSEGVYTIHHAAPPNPTLTEILLDNKLYLVLPRVVFVAALKPRDGVRVCPVPHQGSNVCPTVGTQPLEERGDVQKAISFIRFWGGDPHPSLQGNRFSNNISQDPLHGVHPPSFFYHVHKKVCSVPCAGVRQV
mmetsp:Transcript_1539/g.5394  ORF Transcript_1539/g.5394 Transcript_1539/m.5394 type:complete len:202 (+) Transcript_1539:1817-2422(+)